MSLCRRLFSVLCAVFLVLPAAAFGPADSDGHLAERIRPRAGGVIGLRSLPAAELAEGDATLRAWERFRERHGDGWKLYLDGRSDRPQLITGQGIRWVEPGTTPELASLELKARQLIAAFPGLLGDVGDELWLDLDASQALSDRTFLLSFRQRVAGVVVEGARYDFHVAHGNLVAFGSRHFAPVRTPVEPRITRQAARQRLNAYLGLSGTEPFTDLDAGSLQLIPVDPETLDGGAWVGARGRGYDHRLVWRFVFADPDDVETWVGEVDALSGEIFAFYDDTRYEQVQGGVNPISDDGVCATGGCNELGYPMPFVDVSTDGGADVYTGEFGVVDCNPGESIATNLNGIYTWINDICGPISASASCDDTLDLGQSAGINCSVEAGASAGNTDAARSAYYSFNRVNQKARFWLPGNSWLEGQVETRTNVNSTCNASWGGRINMYRAGNGCGNTSQIQGVLVHEWGHGFDQNDGGGYDNSSEAYADVVAIFESRTSCVGRGFYADGRTCSGYGDACLSCTGIRDHDWDAREAHTPATPSGFLTDNCGGGSGPCGKSVHCESYVPSESIFDLATRDLPAAGLDADTAWQLAERLWYQSRGGSGGPIFTCSLPSSDSCDAGSWFQQMRVADDDDGNLANGTPHAAALFAAFDRHDIACGNAGDAENQSTSACPTIAAPTLTTKGITNAVELSWDAVADAGGYRVYRNDIGCDRAQVPLVEVDSATTTWLDDDLANDFDVYYRIQAIGTNSACESPVSACVQAAAQPLAGRIKFNQATYGCSNRIGMSIRDDNHSSGSISVTVWSDSEPTPESVVLTETSPGAGKYVGEIFTTSDPAAADGLLSLADGDLISGEYIDEDDGLGGANVPVISTAAGDCVFPVISNVAEQGIGGTSATIVWTTNEIADTEMLWGETTPPGNPASGAKRVTDHSIQLTGLTECTVYYYEVSSTDPAGNTASDDNGGQYYRFETLGDFGSGLKPCHAGDVTVLAATYNCNDSAQFELVDIDLNADPLIAETAQLTITSTTEPGGEVILVTETGANTSIFSGSIATGTGAPSPDGTIQTADGDLLTATYFDADDGAGFRAVAYDTALLDCAGPSIDNLSVNTITDARASLSWNTPEQADSVIEWGTTPALGQIESAPAAVVNHNLLLNDFDSCQQIWFRVSSTDVHGNLAVADDNGAPFHFVTNEIPGLYVLEDFEGDTSGWSLPGEWEVGAPSGLGGSGGLDDPDEAYNHDNVLGHDLSGQGSFPGDYEPNSAETAQSPTWDGTGWANTEILLYRHLNAGNGDNASIWLFTDGIGRPIYLTNGDANTEATYQTLELDISTFADGASQVFLQFQQSANDAGHYSGWNVDDIIFKDSTQPNYAACGSCGAAPAFAGAVSAADNNACGGDGVTVSWAQAPAWGTGSDGSYAVYRDVVPGFTPGPGNLIASGVTTLSYNDLAAPTDQTLYYVVRAENDESCASGPANGGLVDDNTAYVTVSETTSQATPGEVSFADLSVVGGTHVRLEWSAVGAATSYRIYRSTAPDSGFGLLAEVEGTIHDDLGEATNANTYYYKVTGVNACGVEGP